MNREIRVAIVGMILGILSTIATEEMRCIFLPFTSTCLRCIIKHKILGSDPIAVVIVSLFWVIHLIFFCMLGEDDINSNTTLITKIQLTSYFGIVPLAYFIAMIYVFEKCRL